MMSIPQFHRFEIFRFGVVMFIGLAADMGFAWLIAIKTNLPLSVAALFGFLLGAAVNYSLHEVWTFKSVVNPIELSLKRAFFYLISVGLTLCARITAIITLEFLVFRSGWEIIILLTATGFSFLINYILTKYIVFRQRT